MKPLFLNKKFILTFVIALALSGGLAWIFGQVSQLVRDSNSDVQNLNAEIQSSIDEGRQSSAVRSLLEERQGDLSRIYGVFIDRDQPIAFIEKLQDTAKAVSIQLSLDFDAGQSREHELVFRLTAEGSEKNISRYLTLLELMPYSLELRDLNLETLSVNSQGSIVPQAPGKKISVLPPSHRVRVTLAVKTQ